jgi:ABC-type dipeptide/oligopeptide/nickel transport system permease subunit
MTTPAMASTAPATLVREGPGRLARGWQSLRRFTVTKPLAALSGVAIVLMVLVAVLAPRIARYPYDEPHVSDRLHGPSSTYWLGTDGLGRDTFSRIVYGARVSALVSFGAVALGTVIAGTIGIVTGYFGGWIDTTAQRLVDTWMCLPGLVLAISIISITGAGILPLAIILALVSAGGASRVFRSATLGLRENTYMLAARTVGAGHLRIMWRHVLPNILPIMIVLATVQLGATILIESSLSFLGYGIPPPFPSWGAMLNTSTRAHMLEEPLLSIWPGLAITATVFCFNMLGDGLRDVLDPRLRGSR